MQNFKSLFLVTKKLSIFGPKHTFIFHCSIQNLLIKTSDKTKSKRKKLKAIKKGLLDKDLHKEGGETYLKGGFLFFDFLPYHFSRKLSYEKRHNF